MLPAPHGGARMPSGQPASFGTTRWIQNYPIEWNQPSNNNAESEKRSSNIRLCNKDRVSNSSLYHKSPKWSGRQERGQFLALPPSRIPLAGTFAEELLCAGLRVTSLGPRASTRGRDQILISRMWKLQHTWINLLVQVYLPNERQGQAPSPGLPCSRAWPPSTSHATCDSGLSDRIREREGHQARDIGCPEKSEVWKETAMWTQRNESLSLHLWRDRGFLLCHCPTVNLNGVLLCIPFTHL